MLLLLLLLLASLSLLSLYLWGVFGFCFACSYLLFPASASFPAGVTAVFAWCFFGPLPLLSASVLRVLQPSGPCSTPGKAPLLITAPLGASRLPVNSKSCRLTALSSVSGFLLFKGDAWSLDDHALPAGFDSSGLLLWLVAGRLGVARPPSRAKLVLSVALGVGFLPET